MPGLISELKTAGPAAGLHIVIAHQNRMQADALRLACGENFPHAQVLMHFRGSAALLALRRQPADVLLMGLTFEDVDSIDLLNQLYQASLATRILIVTERWDEHILLSLRTARFDGAVDLATESIDTIGHALEQVARGQGYISSTLRRYLIDELPSQLAADDLTATELRVLRVIGDGTDNQEAAQQLGISEATVQTHRRNIMRKLRVSTSAKLVREAVRLGVVRIMPVTALQRPQLALFPRDGNPRKTKAGGSHSPLPKAG